MNCIARINNDVEYTLASFNPSVFNDRMVLELITDDLHGVKALFEDGFYLEIISNDKVIGEYSCFDGYNYISVRPNVYVESIDSFADCLEIHLAKKNIIDQVDEIYKKVNNVVDTESMTLEEYKQYTVKQIGKVCESDIYSGEDVMIGTETKHFSFNLQDQQDLKALFDLACAMPQCRYPWHADSEDCKLYTGLDIIKIYSELQANLLITTTYCNGLNQMIRNAESKEEIDTYEYGCELIEPYKSNAETIIDEMMIVFDNIKGKYGIDEDEPEDPTEDLVEDPEGNNE